MHYIYIGKTEVLALIVGLVTGAIYGLLNLPIPAPPVLGGAIAVTFTFIGLAIVQMLRGEAKFGRPPREEPAPPIPGLHEPRDRA